MNENFIKLTNTVYKVLEFFPESDPLKNRAKDKTLAIMENLASISGTDGWASFQRERIKIHLSEDIDMLLGYLSIGKSQGWLSAVNYLIISNEYEKIKKEIEPFIELTQRLPGIDTPAISNRAEPEEYSDSVLNNPEAKPDSFIPPASSRGLLARQEKILEFLGKNEKAQVMDLQTILPDITKRTIRRDLDELLEAGKITRLGEFNQVFYKIVKN